MRSHSIGGGGTTIIIDLDKVAALMLEENSIYGTAYAIHCWFIGRAVSGGVCAADLMIPVWERSVFEALLEAWTGEATEAEPVP